MTAAIPLPTKKADNAVLQQGRGRWWAYGIMGSRNSGFCGSLTCLSSSLSSIEKMRSEASTWNNDRNNRKTNVDRQFRADNARIKLKRLYSKL